MTQFKPEILTDKRIVVNCKTQAQANNLLAWAHSKGLKWCNHEPYLNNTAWYVYKEYSCYNLVIGEYGDRIAYSTANLRCILSYEEAILC